MAQDLVVDDLVFRNDEGTVLTTSLIVAEKFGKRHDNVLRDIQRLQEKRRTAGLPDLNFEDTDYLDGQGKKQPMVKMDREAFTHLAWSFTGVEAAIWQDRFYKAFEALEHHAQEVTTDVHRYLAKTQSDLARVMVSMQKSQMSTQIAVDEVVRDFKDVKVEVKGVKYQVEDLGGRLAKLEAKKRRDPTPKTREAHMLCLQWLGWRCPLTGEIVSEEDVEIDHFHTNQHPDLKHTWPLSKRGHLLLTTGKISRDDAYRAFSAYQHHLDQWQRLQLDNFVLVAKR